MNKKKYCIVCGTEEEVFYLKGYDENTGERRTSTKCPNAESCPRGCEQNGGHFWPKKQWFAPKSEIKCSRCGDIESVGNGGWY